MAKLRQPGRSRPGGSVAGRYCPAGDSVRLDLVGGNGATSRVILPFDALSSLLRTLPKMLQAALDARFPDGSLRVVQWLGAWRLEQTDGDAGLILRLGTPDGFEVAFTLGRDDADRLGAALAATPAETIQCDKRRTH